jgi:hypothetical protein
MNLVTHKLLFNGRDFEDAGSLDESIEQMERGSLASFGSGGTTDSDNRPDKVGGGLC